MSNFQAFSAEVSLFCSLASADPWMARCQWRRDRRVVSVVTSVSMWTASRNGYGSIPINTIFRGLFTSINPSYFDVNRRGTTGFDPSPNGYEVRSQPRRCKIFWNSAFTPTYWAVGPCHEASLVPSAMLSFQLESPCPLVYATTLGFKRAMGGHFKPGPRKMTNLWTGIHTFPNISY